MKREIGNNKIIINTNIKLNKFKIHNNNQNSEDSPFLSFFWY